MTSGEAWLAAAATAEPWIALGIATAVVVGSIGALRAGRGTTATPSLDAPIPPRMERALLATLLVLATAVRVVGWERALTPAWWFSEVSVLPVDEMLRTGTFWSTWYRQLLATRIDLAYEATAVLPVLAGLQRALGPRFGLSVLAGAIMGVLAVVLAWALGRRMRSQAFGLAFAALVALSPMQLAWSRLSPMCTEAVVHVLAAMLAGYCAGRRGSVLLAIVTAVVAWTSFQQYYGARVSVPLAAVALLAGAQHAGRARRGLLLVVVAAVAFGLVHRAVHHVTFAGSFWPSYQSYVGNKGEQSLLELFERNRDVVVHETRTAIANYFTNRRTAWVSSFYRTGPQNGGLCLVPVALLGLVGLVAVCRRIGRRWPWLVLAGLGLALPALSATTARRLLVFDLAWCALAAHGLLAVIDGIGRRLAYRARATTAVAAVVLLGVWSTIAVFASSVAAGAGFGEHIPFGDAGFGDVVSCKRCLEAARGWQRDVADGAFIVLVDNDARRENRTSPGGLPAYGKIAALAGGARERFVELYALMGNFDVEPPRPGTMYDSARASFADELALRIERTAPQRIVWHFERPTLWERWLAGRLRAAGGVLETFPTALAPQGGLRVVTPWERREDALAVVRGLALGSAPDAPSCFRLTAGPVSVASGPVFVLAADGNGLDRPPDWLLASWNEHGYGTARFTTATTPIGAHIVSLPNDMRRIWFLAAQGQLTAVDLPSMGQKDFPTFFRGLRSGLDCAAFASGHWWAIEPASGHIVSTHEAARGLSTRPWIGVGARAPNELVLASADQEILIYDVAQRAEVARFPARVPPAVRDTVDECTPLAVGRDWIGIANLRTSVLSLYDRGGRDLGTARLDVLLPGPRGLTTIAGAGRYIGVASNQVVRTFEVHVDPACTLPSGAP